VIVLHRFLPRSPPGCHRAGGGGLGPETSPCSCRPGWLGRSTPLCWMV
jgi:hypothetical protein